MVGIIRFNPKESYWPMKMGRRIVIGGKEKRKQRKNGSGRMRIECENWAKLWGHGITNKRSG